MNRSISLFFVVNLLALALLPAVGHAAACPTNKTLDQFPGAACEIGDMTFAKFQVSGQTALGAKIVPKDILVSWSWDKNKSTATINFGFSGQNNPVLSVGQNQTASATISYGVAAGKKKTLTDASISMSDTAEHTGSASFDEKVGGKMKLLATDQGKKTTNNSPQNLGVAAVTVEDVATAMGGIAANGSADISSISATFTEK